MATRDEVYAALDTERAYQIDRWTMSTSGGKNHTLAEWVLYMDHYLGEAKKLLSSLPSPQAEIEGLEFVRKVTALGVVAMEEHGAPHRKRVATPRSLACGCTWPCQGHSARSYHRNVED